MADHYAQLTDTEKAYWDIYTRLRELSDWEGFTEGQDRSRQIARDWLVNQRKEIWRCAEGKKPESCTPGWDILDRRERYAQLEDDSLNGGTCRRLCQLPTGGGTPTEKAAISEREMWWRVSSVDGWTKDARQGNADWLTARRKQVWHLGEDEGWDEAERELRYENLCVATKTGEAYEDWAATHNTTTGEEVGGGSSSREQAVAQCRKHLGTKENPHGSNRGSPQPSGWQNRVYGDDGVPWCACFSTCMAWDSGVSGSGSAGVQVLVDMARQGTGMMRGYTTDPGAVLRGDFAIVGCTSCHVGVVVDSDDPCHLIEGNGDDGGSYNGGEVVEKRRGRSEIVGWCLVDYP